MKLKMLKENHPEMKDGQTTYDNLIAKIYENISKPMNAEEFYWNLNTLAVALKDGHTHLSADEVNRDCIDLPSLEWTKDGLIAKENKAFINTGDKITDIGGKTPDELLKGLDALIPAEVQEWVKANTNAISKGIYLRKLNLVGSNNNVAITYERKGKLSAGELQLHPTGDTIYQSIKKSGSYTSSRNLEWKIDKANNLGIITINTCPSGNQYVKGFRDFFSELNKDKINNIAVDLRKNDGGSDNVINQFLSFIDVQSYEYIGNRTFYNIPKDFRDVTPNDPPPYKGNIYLLTSNSTFSAATDFVVVLQANSIAKIIGQPTGNIPSFFGNVKQCSLPNSKLSLRYATTRLQDPLPEDEQYKAITPDYPIEYKKEDIIEKRDPWLEYAIKLARGI
jgi:C-terminal processing protease CtpA/Prc